MLSHTNTLCTCSCELLGLRSSRPYSYQAPCTTAIIHDQDSQSIRYMTRQMFIKCIFPHTSLYEGKTVPVTFLPVISALLQKRPARASRRYPVAVLPWLWERKNEKPRFPEKVRNPSLGLLDESGRMSGTIIFCLFYHPYLDGRGSALWPWNSFQSVLCSLLSEHWWRTDSA